MIEWSISLGSLITSLITLVGWCFGALLILISMRRALDVHGERLLQLSGRMINMETELKELRLVIVEQATQRSEINALSDRINRLEFRDDARARTDVDRRGERAR